MLVCGSDLALLLHVTRAQFTTQRTPWQAWQEQVYQNGKRSVEETEPQSPQDNVETTMAIGPHPGVTPGQDMAGRPRPNNPHPGGEIAGIRVLSDAVDVAPGTG